MSKYKILYSRDSVEPRMKRVMNQNILLFYAVTVRTRSRVPNLGKVSNVFN